MSEPNPPEPMTPEIFQSLLTTALTPLQERIELLESSHTRLEQGLENFLKQLVEQLNAEDSSGLQEQLKNLAIALKNFSTQLQTQTQQQKDFETQLLTSINRLQTSLDQQTSANT